ncbi:MAG: transposase [Candidatus Wallbacteria bacterium]|nr:transposase [Candidatus Wallbacteria bacterium]
MKIHKLHDRKTNRLPGYDYSTPGAYFVTVCVHNRENAFGKIISGNDHGRSVQANESGKIVEQQWKWLFKQFDHIEIDEYVIMPDHFHGIIHIVMNANDPVGKCVDNPIPVGNGRDRSLRIKPIPQLIGAFKTTTSKLIHQAGFTNFQWQKSYYDHIVRDDAELNRIRDYIINNPMNWEQDSGNMRDEINEE